MASTPIKQRYVGEINIIAELYTFIQTVPGWTVDKYVTDTELYIHNTSSVDAEIGYWSFAQDAASTYRGTLKRYANTGFNTSNAVDAQPGVLENITEVAYHYVDYTYNGMKCLVDFIANEEFLVIYTIVPDAQIVFTTSLLYSGVAAKAYSWSAGGPVIYGSQRSATSVPYYALYFDDGTTGAQWYTSENGVFSGYELAVNYIQYSTADGVQFSKADNSFKFYPFELFVEYDGGYAPVGYIPYMWYAQDPYGNISNTSIIRMGGNEYSNYWITGSADTRHIWSGVV